MRVEVAGVCGTASVSKPPLRGALHHGYENVEFGEGRQDIRAEKGVKRS
jgi:hypothetical protein